MTTEQMKAEAQRIAEANEGTIVHMDADADFFQVRHTVRATVQGIEGDYEVTTNYEWNEFRYEGF